MRIAPSDLLRPDKTGRYKLNWETFAQSQDQRISELYQTSVPVEFRMAGINIFGHDGLIWLLSLCAWRHYDGVGKTLIYLPEDREALLFLNRLRFPHALISAGATIANEQLLWSREIANQDHPYPHSLRYFQLIAEHTWASVTTSLVAHFLPDLEMFYATRARGVLEDIWPFLKALHEVLHNVAIHGGEETGGGLGFACYRSMPPGYPLLRFCSTDLGHGFRATLERKKLDCENEEAAVKIGLIYRHLEPEDGVLGLYRALKFIRDIGGRLSIRSADVLVSVKLLTPNQLSVFDEGYRKPDLEWVSRIAETKRLPWVPGTHVTVDLQLPREMTARVRR